MTTKKTQQTTRIDPILIYLRVPRDWNAEMEQVANQEYRTKASIAKQALREYLDRKLAEMRG